MNTITAVKSHPKLVYLIVGLSQIMFAFWFGSTWPLLLLVPLLVFTLSGKVDKVTSLSVRNGFFLLNDSGHDRRVLVSEVGGYRIHKVLDFSVALYSHLREGKRVKLDEISLAGITCESSVHDLMKAVPIANLGQVKDG